MADKKTDEEAIDPTRITRVLLRDSGWHGVQPGTFAFHKPGMILDGGFSFREERACGSNRIVGTQNAILALAEEMPAETLFELEQSLFAGDLSQEVRTVRLIEGVQRLYAEGKITLAAMNNAYARWKKE